jgi:hypothetical protein
MGKIQGDVPNKVIAMISRWTLKIRESLFVQLAVKTFEKGP